ncbi:tRNA(Ile)-lysidine synthase [Sporanaerobacter acetigenes DSM 13106]|uniref:tRNA(Ile)-lysidine synthase n=1 Tax=Sporanaerobacter acetigenes DSM 13106 TaxID=1123281 RepID=A0A1M5Y629_9FIRM|nr:tRNA(Ile)-lysidine synthase [Sporanaerobacter acetigenes DSM 13106]
MVEDKILNTIKKHNLIENGDNVLVGVSGGPDSMALLYALLSIQTEISFSLYIAHVNHGVRGREADEDEKFVEKISGKLGIPFYSKKIDMEGYAREHKLSSEDAGRRLRYKFFREVLLSINGGKIAVAHNKNDQAETLIMRFFRGTGLDGLKGMEYRNGDIIRPLLDISRNEIEDYILEKNINTRLDRTNLENIYNRNKIRLELIPYIVDNFNPNIVDTLWRTSRTMSNDSEFLEEFSKERYRELVKVEDKNSIILCRQKFSREHIAIKQRIIRHSIYNLTGTLDGISEIHVRNVLELFERGDTGKSVDLPNRLEVKTSYDDLIFRIKNLNVNNNYKYSLKRGQATYVKEWNSIFKMEVYPMEKIQLNFKDRFIKYFDYDKIKGEIYIRNRRLGDTIQPFGMSGNKKLKDLFIDKKIPIDEREKIPILVDKNDIIWVVGLRTSEKYKITPYTKNVLVIKYKNL